MLRQYLQLFRIHTASLTIPAVVIGYLLATNNPSPLYIFLISIYALLFHGFGFLWNNIFDLPYDKEDPYKKHFPLVNGSISFEKTKKIAIFGTASTFIYGLLLFNNNIIAIIFFILAILFGFLYNIFNKKYMHAIVYISLSFTFLSLSPFVNFHSLNHVAFGYGTFTFITMVFQNGISGFIKDMKVNQKNTLMHLGTYLENDYLHIGAITLLYAYVIRFLILVVGILLSKTLLTFLLFAVVQLFVIMLTFMMLKEGNFNRDHRVKLMSLIEVLNYYSLAIIMIDYTTWVWVLFLFIFPIIYFVIMNKILWGTTIYPKV